ncbi:hypothetical protein DES53_104166 [Roseimicrobium gellanilyticum]|uniref:Uncharacterized protein n=1 Tax=Roseimicrobium gellanilyticum TaxID=748857 RepID=A0A366HMI0_9BACT|nr:hypothetical protein DES53_104166 [Roseimicrobium gellanilyticum]
MLAKILVWLLNGKTFGVSPVPDQTRILNF